MREEEMFHLESKRLTAREMQLVKDSLELMPERFRATANSARVLQFLEIVVADINAIPPAENLTVDTLPEPLIPIVRFGASVYASIFQQMRATLDDFTWSDQGITVSIDQTGKISTALANMTKAYERMIINFKKTRVIAQGGQGLGTPRYQSQLGQFLKIALGSSFLFNSF
jgi:hypothetical protein